MPNLDDKLNDLNLRLQNLVKYQDYFNREIEFLRRELAALNNSPVPEVNEIPPLIQTPTPPTASVSAPPISPKPPLAAQTQNQNSPREAKKSNVEKFIGENLIATIGIIITVLGVGIGAKYAIDNNLISAAGRILLGYLFGAGLIGTALWLKPKYRDFSAVLFGGGAAIWYFITYAAFSFYDLIGQFPAFGIMLFLTALTVAAAINYNRQIIAHIGLVGAYAIPFLLGGDNPNITVLFGYIALINVGVLSVSALKDWKSLFYSSFIFTWATYAVWFAGEFGFNLSVRQTPAATGTAFTFAIIFFLIFYATFLAYKMRQQQLLRAETALMLLANAFVFYGFGVVIWRTMGGADSLGLFTVGNAALHLAVAFLLSRLKIADRDLSNLLIGLFLVFVTLAVPIQFNGDWVTLGWTAMAVLLFYLGRTGGIKIYEFFSYGVMALATLSLLNGWQNPLNDSLLGSPEFASMPIFNHGFLTAILFAAGFAFIHYVNRNPKFAPAVNGGFHRFTIMAIPTLFLFVLYNAFRVEIKFYWDARRISGGIALPDAAGVSSQTLYDNDLDWFNIISQIDYTLLFLAVLAFVNLRKPKSFAFGAVNLLLSGIALLIFLTAGLYLLGELRESYLLQTNAEYFPRGWFHVFARYLSLAAAAVLLTSFYQLIHAKFVSERLPKNYSTRIFDAVFYASLWWILSAELLNLLALFGNTSISTNLGLSVFWGFYALALIILGIWQRKAYLRIAAIVLFAVTLAKLFLVDIADLDTISKTIVFVLLGLLLLVISFLYNKYKATLFVDKESG